MENTETLTMKSEELKAIVSYGRSQCHDSYIEVLDFGDIESGLNEEEQLKRLEELKTGLYDLTASGDCELLILPKNHFEMWSVPHLEMKKEELKAVVYYGYLQCHDSYIQVLDFGEKDSGLDEEEQLERLKRLDEMVIEFTKDIEDELIIMRK